MASTTKIAPVFLIASPIARTSCAAPVEVSDACTNTPLHGWVRGQSLRDYGFGAYDAVRIGASSTTAFKPVSLGDFRPAFAEFSGRADDDLVARARNKLETEASMAPVPEATSTSTSLRGAHHFLQVGQHAAIEIPEILGSMMDVGAHHRVQSLRIKRGRTGS